MQGHLNRRFQLNTLRTVTCLNQLLLAFILKFFVDIGNHTQHEHINFSEVSLKTVGTKARDHEKLLTKNLYLIK